MIEVEYQTTVKDCISATSIRGPLTIYRLTRYTRSVLLERCNNMERKRKGRVFI